MPFPRSWSDEDLRRAVKQSFSVRAVIKKLGLVPAGGNYAQVNLRIKQLDLATTHFKGKGWNKNLTYHSAKRANVNDLLRKDSDVQSYKLKKRLFESGLKQPKCELCGWCTKTPDGRIPVELDHINGDHSDNRLANLRILCPNCHSLQPTHRGLNKHHGQVAE